MKYLILRRVALVCLVITGITQPITRADWLQFRGTNTQAIGEGVLIEANTPLNEQITWRAELPGRGLSSPLILGNRIYLTAATGPQQDQLEILCLNASTGSLLWKREFWATGRTMCHEKTSVAASTPACDGEFIVALFSSNDLICLDLDGNLQWLRGLMQDYPNASNSLGMASSVVIVSDVAVVQIENDGHSLALGIEMASGINRWVLNRPKAANWTSPVLLQHPLTGNALVALQSSRGITVVEPESGAIVSEYTEGAATVPSSVVHDNLLYVPSHGITALKMEEGKASMTQVWRSARLRPGTASPIVVQDRMYVLNGAGVLNCASLEDGERLWQTRLTGPFSASPVGWDHWLLAVNENGLVQWIDLATKEGKTTGTLDLDETILSTPSLSGGAVYIRSDRYLWKIGG